MSAYKDTLALRSVLERRGIGISTDDVNTLRRAQMTLHRWHELECGDGNDHASWAIERDEKTGKPYLVTYPHNEPKPRRHRIADRENGAIKRVASVCGREGLHFFVQTDPRGCALYVSREPINDSNYSMMGIPCAV